MTVVTTREQVPQIMRAAPAVHRPAAAPGAGLTGKDVLRILQKRIWLILICLLSTIAVVCVATYLWVLYFPLFTAEALVEVNQPRTVALGPESYTAPQDYMDRQAMQLARLIEADVVMSEAVKDKDLVTTAWYNKDPGSAPRRLKDDLSIAPLAKTNLIRIAMTGMVPKDLADIVNASAWAAVREATASRQTDWRDKLKKIDEELTNANRLLDQARLEASRLTSDATMSSLRNRGDTLNYTMSTLVPELTKLTVAQAAADEALRLITKQQETPGALENSPEVQQALEMDQTLRGLEMQQAGYATELDANKKKFGPKHFVVLRLQDRLESIQGQIRDRRQEQIALQVKGMVRAREDQLNAITAQLVKIRTEYIAAENTARDLAARVSKLDQIQKTIKDLEDQVTAFQKGKYELTLMAQSAPPITMRRQATIPVERAYPQWKVMVPVGVLFGLLIGLGLAFMLELMDTSIKSPSDITRRVDLPVLGMVPHLDDIDEEIADLRLAYRTAPDSVIGEAFRQVRTCLLFSGPAANRRSLLVASPLPEDGRTSVALNLAAAMAQGGRKVLVIDCNFRQPMIHTLFPQCPGGGLSDALVGQEKWQSLVRNVDPNLFVLASGRQPPNPAELLGSESMRAILAEMVAEYDQVIFDGAPALVVSDSSVLATLVDGVIMVVRAGTNTYGIVQRARDTFHRVGAHVLGVVLNGIRVTAGGYLRKNYETFYEYRAPQAPLVTQNERPQ